MIKKDVTPKKTPSSFKPLASENNVIRSTSSHRPSLYVSQVKIDMNEKAEGVDLTAWQSTWSLDLHEGEPSLTVKALVAGAGIGIICNFLALYYSLKTGVIPSLNIICGLGGFCLVKFLLRLKICRGSFTPQENAVIQTAATACYTVSSIGMFGAVYLAMGKGAYEDMGGDGFEGNRISDTIDLNWINSFVWCISIAFFGFFVAFPVRDYFILKKQLPFPSGTLTAVIIKNLHSKDSGEQTAENFNTLAKFFSIAFVVQCLVNIYDGLGTLTIFGTVGHDIFTYAFDWDLGSFGIGCILSTQVVGGMAFGSLFLNGVIYPYLHYAQNGPGKWYDDNHLPGNSSYLGRKCYQVFLGLGVMLMSGLVTIILIIITVCQGLFTKKKEKSEEEIEGENTHQKMEKLILEEIFRTSRVPVWLPYVGYCFFGLLTVLLLHFEFNILWYQTLLALIIIPILAVSNAQGIGTTDWDVSMTYGKVVMFPIAGWNYGKNIIPSMALAGVTAAGCSNCGTLLQDFKTGLLVGATPHAMFISQFLGAALGCFVSPSLFVLLSTAYKLPNSNDPNAMVTGMFGSVFRTLGVIICGGGITSLPKNVVWFLVGSAIITAVCLTIQIVAPPRYTRFIPNITGVGIGILVPSSVTIDFSIGAFIRWWWMKRDKNAEFKLTYMASGVFAGTGMAVILRCLVSLSNLKPPVSVRFHDTPQTVTIAQYIAGFIFLIVMVLVGICGLFFCFPHLQDELLEEEPVHEVVTEGEEAKESPNKKSSFNTTDEEAEKKTPA